MWASGLSYPVTGTVFRSPQCVSCDSIEEGNALPENEVITEANAWIELDFSLIEHPLKVLDQKSQRPEDKQYECTKYNGVTTRKKRQLGRRKNTSTPSIWDSYNLETVISPSYLIVLSRISGRDSV
jgi:hypothetical protein